MQRKILILIFAGVLMGALDIAIIGPALPAIKVSFGLSDRDLPWLFNIYVLMNLVSTPLMGKLSDLYGRRGIYVLNLALFGLGSLIVSSSASFAMLIIGRGIQGFGAGGIFPVASAVIGDTIPKEKQGSALGWIGAVFGLAFIIGPALGGLLLVFGWKWIFLINIPFALTVGCFSWKLLPYGKKTTKIAFDWAGMLMLIASLVLFAYGINRINSSSFFRSLASATVYLPILFSLMFLAGFWLIQKNSPHPTVQIYLLRSSQLLITYAIAFVAGVGEISTVYLPSLTITAFQVSTSTASFMLLPLVFTLFIFSPVAGRLIDKTNVRLVILTGILLLLIGFLIFYKAGLTKNIYFLASSLIGAGLSFLLGAPLRYIMNRETSMENRASGQSILTLFTSTGQLLSAALAGAYIQSLGNNISTYKSLFGLLAAICLPLLLLSFRLKTYSN